MPRFTVLLGATAISVAASTLVASTQSRSASSGVYSQEQADRGRRVFVRDCAQCHGENLLGAEAGPPLAGEAFLGRWSGKSVGALYGLIRKTMPEGAPGSLPERQYVDLVAYLLSENAFPAGANDLPRDLEALASIVIEQKHDRGAASRR